MIRLLVALVLAAASLISSTPGAFASTPAQDGSIGGAIPEGGNTVEIIGREQEPDGGVPAAEQTGASGPALVFARIPACPGNDIETGVDIPCPEAETACGVPGMYQYWLYSGIPAGGQPLTIGMPGWTFVGAICSAPAAPGEAGFPGLSLEDFQRLPLPAGGAQVEPPGQYVLVNMPTNVFTTTTEPSILTTTVLGVPVQVRATPERWSWDFGDGAVVGPTSDPGAAYPALTNTHQYAARGTYDIVMTTYYAGEFSIDGATWYPIQGEAQVDSAPVTVQALAGSNVLVAEP